MSDSVDDSVFFATNIAFTDLYKTSQTRQLTADEFDKLNEYVSQLGLMMMKEAKANPPLYEAALVAISGHNTASIKEPFRSGIHAAKVISHIIAKKSGV